MTTQDRTFDVSNSQALLERARGVIPGGLYGHYGASMRRTAPVYCARADGSRFWDVDDNEYIDYMCAFGPMILGYNHPVVDDAARAQSAVANTVSLAAPVMVDLAEKLVDMVSAAEWAMFAKNGGDVTNCAVMVARAATGRDKIVKVDDGYHGVAGWMQDAGKPGTTRDDSASVLKVAWNDADALEATIRDNPGEIACFISSPYHHPVLQDNILPADGYWQKVEKLCRDAGIVLVVDDVRSGFRINLAGSNVEYGFTPDLICFGKGIANGYALSALVGNDAMREAAGNVMFTGTSFFSAPPMAAALATLRELERQDGARVMTDIGARLNDGLVRVAREHGFDLRATGIPAMPYYRLANVDMKAHFAWIDECVKRGVYLLGFHNHFLSTAHTDEDLELTWSRAGDAFEAVLASGIRPDDSLAETA